MVRFEDKLRQNAVKEWASHYIDYRRLKQILQEDSPAETSLFSFSSSPTTASPLTLGQGGLVSRLLGDDAAAAEGGESRDSRLLEQLILPPELLAQAARSPYAATDARFRRALVQEVVKADAFYTSAVAGFAEELDLLESQAAATQAKQREQKSARVQTLTQRHRSSSFAESAVSASLNFPGIRLTPLPADDDAAELPESVRSAEAAIDRGFAAMDRDLASLRDGDSRANQALKSAKRAYVDLYRKLCFLENFCILNYTAVVKVLNNRFSERRPLGLGQ
jgi:hypothetical protein